MDSKSKSPLLKFILDQMDRYVRDVIGYFRVVLTSGTRFLAFYGIGRGASAVVSISEARLQDENVYADLAIQGFAVANLLVTLVFLFWDTFEGVKALRERNAKDFAGRLGYVKRCRMVDRQIRRTERELK